MAEHDGEAPRRRRRQPEDGEEVPFALSKTELWVGNLPEGTDNDSLQQLFAQYGNITKVRTSRRAGQVRFEAAESADSAVAALNGQEFNGNELRVEHKHVKNRPRRRRGRGGAGGDGNGAGEAEHAPQEEEPIPESNPLRVFVGSLSDVITEEDLRQHFSDCGEIAELEQARNNRFCLITFTSEDAAVAAAEKNGTIIKDMAIRVEREDNEKRARNRNRRRAAGARRGAGRRDGGASGEGAADGGEEGARPRRRQRRPRRDGEPNPLRVWVGNLPENYDIDNVVSAFGAQRAAKQGPRFAFLVFETADEAAAAIAKNDSEVFSGAEPVRVEASKK